MFKNLFNKAPIKEIVSKSEEEKDVDRAAKYAEVAINETYENSATGLLKDNIGGLMGINKKE